MAYDAFNGLSSTEPDASASESSKVDTDTKKWITWHSSAEDVWSGRLTFKLDPIIPLSKGTKEADKTKEGNASNKISVMIDTGYGKDRDFTEEPTLIVLDYQYVTDQNVNQVNQANEDDSKQPIDANDGLSEKNNFGEGFKKYVALIVEKEIIPVLASKEFHDKIEKRNENFENATGKQLMKELGAIVCTSNDKWGDQLMIRGMHRTKEVNIALGDPKIDENICKHLYSAGDKFYKGEHQISLSYLEKMNAKLHLHIQNDDNYIEYY